MSLWSSLNVSFPEKPVFLIQNQEKKMHKTVDFQGGKVLMKKLQEASNWSVR